MAGNLRKTRWLASRSCERSERLAKVGGEAGIRARNGESRGGPEDEPKCQGAKRNGGEAGIRTLRTRFFNLMMAKDFWQQVFIQHHVPVKKLSTHVAASLPESTSVLATLWQRLSRRIF